MCVSVRPSVKRVNCDKTKQTSAHILITYENVDGISTDACWSWYILCKATQYCLFYAERVCNQQDVVDFIYTMIQEQLHSDMRASTISDRTRIYCPTPNAEMNHQKHLCLYLLLTTSAILAG